MSSLFNNPDETTEARASRRPADLLSQALGSKQYVADHRFGDLAIVTALGRSPRLRVGRYYWDLEPPVAVDFKRHMRRRQEEIPVKQKYFREHGIRYLLLMDEWDVESLRAEPESQPAGKPLAAPRQRH